MTETPPKDFDLDAAAEAYVDNLGLTGRIRAHAIAQLKKHHRAKFSRRTETKATARRRRQIERGILKPTGGE